MSTNTGVAPTSEITSAVEMKVKGTVITSSPGPMPRAINAIWRESVPLETVRQCLTPTYSASCFSSSATCGPRMYCPSSRTSWMAAFISSLWSWYCFFRSMNCIVTCLIGINEYGF